MKKRWKTRTTSLFDAALWYTLMISVIATAHISSDRMLTIAVPKPLHDIEVVVAIQPMPAERGWRPDFFETTYGSLKDGPIERRPQGEYEVREAME